jgi:hypothetical protein
MNVAPQGYSPLPPHQQQQQVVGPTQPDWEEFFTEQFSSSIFLLSMLLPCSPGLII